MSVMSELTVTTLDVIASCIKVGKAAGEATGLCVCPFHQEKNPSLYIYPDEYGGHFHCYGCGEHGDGITFIQKFKHVSFGDAVAYIKANVEGGTVLSAPLTTSKVTGGATDWPPDDMITAVLEIHAVIAALAVASARWLAANCPAERRLATFGPTAMSHWQIGFLPKDDHSRILAQLVAAGYSRELLGQCGITQQSRLLYNRILVPLSAHPHIDLPDWLPEGHAVGPNYVGFASREIWQEGPATGEAEPKYINSRTTRLYRKARYMYGLDRAAIHFKAGCPALAVEGYGDVTNLHAAGVRCAVGLGGTAMTSAHVRVLEQCGAPHIYVLYDGDDGGRQAAERMGDNAEKSGWDLSATTCPGGTDPADLMRAGGHSRDAVVQLLEMAGLAAGARKRVMKLGYEGGRDEA